MKVAKEQQINVFHKSENFQNVFILDISNMKRAPPIGAPKATLTPAEAPAAMKCLLLVSFCRNLKISLGMYRIRQPTLAPICASGPSFPIHKVPATASTTPKVFVMSVLILMVSG